MREERKCLESSPPMAAPSHRLPTRSQGGESLSQRQESLKAGTISNWSQYFASAINLSQRSQDIVNVNKRTSTTVDVCIQNWIESLVKRRCATPIFRVGHCLPATELTRAAQSVLQLSRGRLCGCPRTLPTAKPPFHAPTQTEPNSPTLYFQLSNSQRIDMQRSWWWTHQKGASRFPPMSFLN